MNAEKLLGIVLFFSLLAVSSTVAGQEKSQQVGSRGPQSGWTTLSRGGAVYQFDAERLGSAVVVLRNELIVAIAAENVPSATT